MKIHHLGFSPRPGMLPDALPVPTKIRSISKLILWVFKQKVDCEHRILYKVLGKYV